MTQPLEQLGVGCREGKAADFPRADPGQGGAGERLRVACEQLASEKPQVNHFLRVRVGDGFDQVVDPHLHAQFLPQFTLQAMFVGLCSFPFAAREFPEATEMIASPALGDEEFALVKDEPGGHLDRGDDGGWGSSVHRPMPL
jgi:hypothetical protein